MIQLCGLRPRARPASTPWDFPELISVELCSPPLPLLPRPSLVRRRAAVLGEAALIWNGSTELGSDVTEELTACMIAKAQHDTPRGNLSKESYRTMRVRLREKGPVAYL